MNKKTLYMIGGVAAALLVAAIVLLIAFGGSGSRKYEQHYDAAEAAFLQRDYDKALKELDKAMEIETTEDSYLLMADIYYAQGDLDMAIQVLVLGYSHVGGQPIADMLDNLKLEANGKADPAPTSVTVGGTTYALDATSAVLSDKGLGNEDVAALGNLAALEELTISGNNISDITPLANLKWLTSLQLAENNVSDLTALSQLYALKTLYIDGNPVKDFTALEGLTALRTLSMKGIIITEQQLASLQKALPNCRIYSDTPTEVVPEITLGGRTFRADVTELNLGGLELEDISELAQCTELRKLDLRDNKITDISALENCRELEWLCLWNNLVEDLTPLAATEKLAYLDIDTNKVSNVIALEGLTNLEELWLSNNQLLNIEPLRGMTKLGRLGLKNIGLTDDAFEVIALLPNLKELTIEGNEGLSQEKFDALQAALPDCTIAHSELVAPEPTEKTAEETPEVPDITPDETYVALGRDTALNAAGTGGGYAVIWDAGSAASAGFRKGFIEQAKTLGMNVVGDFWYDDIAEEAFSLIYSLSAQSADTVFVAAGDDAISALLEEAQAIGYSPKFIQMF